MKQGSQFRSVFPLVDTHRFEATPGSISPNAFVDISGTFPGATVGDQILVSLTELTGSLEDLQAVGVVTATDTITFRISNPTGGAIDPGTMRGLITVLCPTNDGLDTVTLS